MNLKLHNGNCNTQHSMEMSVLMTWWWWSLSFIIATADGDQRKWNLRQPWLRHRVQRLCWHHGERRRRQPGRRHHCGQRFRHQGLLTVWEQLSALFWRPWWVDHQWEMKTFNWGFWKFVDFDFCPTEKPITFWLGEEEKKKAVFSFRWVSDLGKKNQLVDWLLVFSSRMDCQSSDHWWIVGLQIIDGLLFFSSLMDCWIVCLQLIEGLLVFSSLTDCCSSAH